MNNNSISVTFQLEGAVRLLRTTKKLDKTLTSNISGTVFVAPKGTSSHDVQVESTTAKMQREFSSDFYLSMPSRSQMHSMDIHGKNAPKQWGALSVEKKINANLTDFAHDLGAISFDWHFID